MIRSCFLAILVFLLPSVALAASVIPIGGIDGDRIRTLRVNPNYSVNDFSQPITGCRIMNVNMTYLGAGGAISMYATDVDSTPTVAEIEADIFLDTYDVSDSMTLNFAPKKQEIRFVIDAVATKGDTVIEIECITYSAEYELRDNTATTDIATIVTDVATNVTDIATNVTDVATNATDIVTLDGLVLNVRNFGAVGDGATDDTTAFQAAVTASVSNATILIPEGAGVYLVDLYALSYGSKIIRWIFLKGATTTVLDATQVYITNGGNGGTATFHSSKDGSTEDEFKSDIYRVIGTNSGNNSRVIAYHFELINDGEGAGDHIRGLQGAVTNSVNGIGEIKSIRVAAVDLNVTEGATALMAFNGSITANAATAGAVIMFLQDFSADEIDDVVTALRIGQTNTPRWENGLLFDQGMEYNNAVIQASMGSGSSASALFLKLKDDPGAVTIFSVDKLGIVRAVAVHGGMSPTNSIEITNSTIQRTAVTGTIVMGAGTDAGNSIHFRTAGATQLQIDDLGIIVPSGNSVFFGSVTGPSISTGTGTPEGAVTAPISSMFMRSDGGGGTSLYVKESGTGNTGWAAM